jgi:hypothetical protein
MPSRTRSVRDRLRRRIAVALKPRGEDSSPAARNSISFGSCSANHIPKSLTFNPCHPERTPRDPEQSEPRAESNDPEGAGCHHAASWSSTETFREERLDEQYRGRCTGLLRLYLAPLVARVPLRMKQVRNPRPPLRHAIPNAKGEGPAPLPYRGSPEAPRSRFLACGSEQHVVLFLQCESHCRDRCHLTLSS